MAHQSEPLTTAIIGILRDSDLVVGDSIAPKDTPAARAGWDGDVFYPYIVLYPLTGGVADGPIDDREADFESMYQITGVGSGRQQAEWLCDRARLVLMSTPILIPGRLVLYVRTDMEGGIQRDDADGKPSLFYKADRYRVATTP